MAKEKYWDGTKWVQVAPSMQEFDDHLADDTAHGIFKIGAKRYQGKWLPNNDLTGMKFVYEEV